LSPLEELYLVLALVYLLDCAHWVRRRASVFRARWKRFELQQGGALFGNEHAGLNLAWPLPPLGRLHVCDAPLAAHEQGCEGEWLLSWSEAAALRVEGRDLRAGRRVFARASSPRAAQLWYAELRALSALAPARRNGELEARRRERFDARAIAERRDEAARACAPLLPWAHAQLGVCFVGAPLAIERFGLVPVLPWLVALLLAVQLGAVVSFARAHERVWPGERAQRRVGIASIALSPPGAMRCADLLVRDLFAGREPLAVASVLLERPEFERLAGARLRAERHPVPGSASRAPELRELERFLAEQGLDPARLDAPPAPLAADCLCYCPRCQAQFVIAGGSCEACSGVALVAFGRPGEQRAEAQPRGARGA
jgi:hypothetical protein